MRLRKEKKEVALLVEEQEVQV
jgi:hypothetical protein